MLMDLLKGYFKGDVPADQLGRRAREIVSRHFTRSDEFYSLAVAAFQRAVDATLMISFAAGIGCPYSIWPPHHSLVGNLFPRSFPALSGYKEYVRGPCTHRKCERIKASVDQY